MEDKEMCMNCKRDIPCTNYRMHTAHCTRHITLCAKCNEPIPKKDFDAHKCDHVELQAEEVAKKAPISVQKSTVGKKPIEKVTFSGTRPKLAAMPQQPDAICQFCHLEFPRADIPDHENYCGSRTERCPECSDYVMLKDWKKHEEMRLYHELAKKPSSEVFKHSEEQRSIQRSASGRSLQYVSSARRASQSNLFKVGDDFDTPSRFNNPFGGEYSRSATSKSLKSLLDESSLHQGSNSFRKYSSDNYKVERSSSTTFSSSHLRNYSASSSRRLERRNSGTFTYKTSYNEVNNNNTPDNDDVDALSSNVGMWNTSIEEQKRILMEIEKQKQAKSSVSTAASTTLSSSVDISSMSSSSSRLRSLSRTRNARIRSPSREVDLIRFDDDPLNVPEARKPRSMHRLQVADNRSFSYDIQAQESKSSFEKSTRFDSANYDNYTPFVKKKKESSSIVDKFLKSERSQSSRRKQSAEKNLRFQVNSSDDDLGLPDLMPFPVGESHTRKTSLQHFDNSYNDRPALPKKRSVVDKYISEQNVAPPPRRLPIAPQASNATGGSLLQRQDSYTNLSSLQDEINSMLTNPRERKSSFSSSAVAAASPRVEVTSSKLRSIRATALAASMLSEPVPRRKVSSDAVTTELKRETLREMLNKLRKDPLDDDLDKCDGEYFPCEFCGDPYPVEYIMRHQLSCDLNPNPVTEGNGFDYSEIARRAAANMALARE